MDMNITGIQCDAKDCDYESDEKITNYDEWLNAPCPKCGANLLTEADLRTVKMLDRLCNNPVVKALNKAAIKAGEKIWHSDVKMNGTGNIDVDFKEKKK